MVVNSSKSVPSTVKFSLALVAIEVALLAEKTPLARFTDLKSNSFLEASFAYSPLALLALACAICGKRLIAQQPERYFGRIIAAVGVTLATLALVPALLIAVGVAIVLIVYQ